MGQTPTTLNQRFGDTDGIDEETRPMNNQQMNTEESNRNWRRIWTALTILALLFVVATCIVFWVYFNEMRENDDDDSNGAFFEDCSMTKASEFTLLRQFPDVAAQNWPMYGRDYAGTRNNPHFSILDLDDDDASGNEMECTVDSSSGVSATITHDTDGYAYFPDWGDEDQWGTWSDAKLYKMDPATCNRAWVVDVADIAADPHTVVRTSLSLFTDSTGVEGVFFCDMGTPNLTCTVSVDPECGAYCYALRRDTGALMWRTHVSTQPFARVTSSPTIVGQRAYFGLSSSEAAQLQTTGFDATFVGEAYELNLNEGALVWVQPTISDTTGANLTGGSVWGSPIPYDIYTDTAVYGTGNLYTLNDNVTDCLNTNGENAWTCLPDNVWPDSLFAIRGTLWGHREPRDMDELWVHNLQGVDAWNLDCLEDPSGPNCPAVEGPDYDLGAGAIIIHDDCHEAFVVSQQKSGVVWSFHLDTGTRKWATYAGPGATLSNGWGMAYDGHNFYLASGNNDNKYYRTLDGVVRCDGFWAALDAFTGDMKWVTPVPLSRASSGCPQASADPALERYFSSETLLFANRGARKDRSAVPMYPDQDGATDPRNDVAYAVTTGPMTVANGVVYATSWNGYVYKLDPRDGDIKGALQRCSSGSIYGGVTASRYWDGSKWVEQLSWGCGYDNVPGPLPGNSVVFYNVS